MTKIGNTNAAKPAAMRRLCKQFSLHATTLAWLKLLSHDGDIPVSTVVAEAVKFYALHVLDKDLAERECARQEAEALTANKAHLLRNGMTDKEHADALADALTRANISNIVKVVGFVAAD